jgi:hypothetical protein
MWDAFAVLGIMASVAIVWLFAQYIYDVLTGREL